MSNKRKNYILIGTLAIISALTGVVVVNNSNKLDRASVETKEVFKATERLTFKLDLSGNSPQVSMLTNSVYAQEDAQYTDQDTQINPKIVNVKTGEELEVTLEVTKIDDDIYSIEGDYQNNSFTPGKYELQVEVIRNGESTSVSQDFDWGVLAINPNKSMYEPGETAIIGMAVLDDEGEMVCDANVELVITNPEGLETVISTQNGNININPNCTKKEFIPSPDFEAKYAVDKLGTYNMRLTAETSNGTYVIEDFFEVRSYVPFSIERRTATRIYPPINYPVTIIIRANEDFTGKIVETVPRDFEIISDSFGNVERKVNEDYKEGFFGIQFVQSAEYQPTELKAKVETINNSKTISWEVELKKGEEYQLEYVYKAPEISPEFYLIGPLSLIDYGNKLRFEELRKWQIASDAIAYVNSNALNSQNVTSVSATLTTSSANYLVFFCGSSVTKTITGPGGSWTQIYNEAADPSWATFHKQAAGGSETPTCSWTGSTTGGAVMLEYSGVNISTPIAGNNTATGSGDSTVECPVINPGTDTYQYVSALIYKSDTTVSTWSNTFTGRQNTNTGTGTPALRVAIAAADKNGTGSQSTTATMGAGPAAWKCHAVALNTSPIVDDSITGRVFTDDNEASAISSVSVCLSVSGKTPVCNTTDGSGIFTISTPTDLTDELIFFIDGGTTFGNTATLGDGGNIVTSDNLRIYQNHVVVRHETGSGLRINNMDSYDNTNNATDMLYDATDAATDTISVETPNELFVQAGFTFLPTGNVTASHDIEIDGVWTSQTGETVNLSGTYKQDVGGTLNASTSTVTFDGTGGTELLITDGTGPFYNLTLNDGGNNLTVQVEDPLVVANTLTITGGTLDVKSGENNQITTHANWDNDDTFLARNGLVLFDGSGATTYTIDADGPGTDNFWDITFNDAGGGSTYQLTTVMDVNGDVTITGGTLNSNGNNITVGQNWTNDDTFTEGTATVTFDGTDAAILDSGCASAATCTNENFYNVTINKGAGPKTVTLANTDLRLTNLLNIIDGKLVQGALNLRAEGASAITIAHTGMWQNISTGNITLGGTVTNDGRIQINSNGIACGDADSIQIRSTAAAQRSWVGSGSFVITDVDVEYQAGTATIRTASSTDSLNNGTNWLFVPCNETYFEGLDFEGINVD